MPEETSRFRPPEVDRLAASRAAVAARRARAAVKESIADGSRSPSDVLDAAWADPAGVEGRLRVTEFLTAIPAIGTTKMRSALHSLGISHVKRIGGLGRFQRGRLAAYVTEREEANRQRRPCRLTVLAGPTAVGKGTISRHIRIAYPQIMLSVSATTRPPRPGEIEGENYYFVDDDSFDRMIADGQLLEWATVHNAYRYGTPRRPVEEALEAGRPVLLEIDLAGARSVREAMPEATLIFLAPPSWEELVRRLVGRGTEDAAERARRLHTARVELAAVDEFDHRVVNDDVATAAQQVVELMETCAAPGSGGRRLSRRHRLADQHQTDERPPSDKE